MSHSTAFLSRLPNGRLWVVPYARGRLVFAAIAARTLQERSFDTVLVDLPCFMNQPKWLDAPLASFPLVSSLLVKGDDGTCSLYPLVPTDAACATAWLARNRSLAFECADPVILTSPCGDPPPVPQPALRDERLVLREGPESYFETAWLELDALWQKAPDASVGGLVAHGEAVADRISAMIAAGRETLFVCEYRLWWAVRKALVSPPGSRAQSLGHTNGSKARLCALLLEDPYLLWAAGLFDDYLAVNRKFQESLESGSVSSFHKFAILEDFVRRCSGEGGSAGMPCPSSNALTALFRRLRNEKETEAGRSLRPARFLERARSCLRPEATDALVRSILDYPLPTAADAVQNPPAYFEVAGERIVSSDGSFDLPDVFHVRPYGEPRRSEIEGASQSAEDLSLTAWLHRVHPVITRQEAKAFGEMTIDSRWAVERDYEVHSQACSLIRQAVARAKPADPEREELGTHTPVVFFFCDESEEPRKLTVVCDNNPARREMRLRGLEPIPLAGAQAPDSVYSVFATTEAAESLFETHVERELITSLALLFSGTGMGVERHSAITGQPKRFQCRTRPHEDPALSAFKSHDLCLAWAVKYARKSVLAVACPGWEPSQAVQRFARRRRKSIVTVPLHVLPEDMARRLRRLHFISNALKAHPDCERIVARFVG